MLLKDLRYAIGRHCATIVIGGLFCFCGSFEFSSSRFHSIQPSMLYVLLFYCNISLPHYFHGWWTKCIYSEKREDKEKKNMSGSTYRKRPRSDVGPGRKKPAKHGGGELTERMSHQILEQVRSAFLFANTITHRDR